MEREYQGPDSRAVRQMFTGIAHRYDFLNHFLSASIDRYWRRITVNKVRELIGASPSALCLDACSGTGDLALALRRGLKPGGAAVVLEFSKPIVPVFRHVFNFYFRYVLPRLGAAISGDGTAYQYLPDSVRKFPAQIELMELMQEVGFKDAAYRNLSGGIAALHWGRKG